jgi:hypothetical protein
MRDILINDLKKRLADEITNNMPLKYLRNHSIEECFNLTVPVMYLYTKKPKRQQDVIILMSELICAIGHKIRDTFKLKKDTSLAAKTGAFFLYSFERAEIVRTFLGKGKNDHGTMLVDLLEPDTLSELWTNLPEEHKDKLPSETPFEPWMTTKHPTGKNMVKTRYNPVLKTIKLDTHKILFDNLNRSQQVGWLINKEIYSISRWALRNKVEAFSDIWEQHNPEAKATKLREAKSIIEIATLFLDKTFYHLYSYDFRGRKYVSTAYLNEQGGDLSRGLLLRKDKKSIGKQGFFWLMVSIATNWGGDSGREDELKTDKIPLEDRCLWSVDNEEILLAYAEQPKINQGWMSADKPWQFLAACIELKNLRVWQCNFTRERIDTPSGTFYTSPDFNNFEYESHLECYVDGSNNGSQHLSALTRDHVTAPLVNLVKSKFPGDLYKFIADNVWDKIQAILDDFDDSIIMKCEIFIDNMIEFKKRIIAAEPNSDIRKEAVESIKKLKNDNKGISEQACAVFWCRIKDAKHKRKIVKRNIMTLPLIGGSKIG